MKHTYKNNYSITSIIWTITGISVIIVITLVTTYFCLNGNNSTWWTIVSALIAGGIGGAGTLVAVIFTTLQTRQVQKEAQIEAKKKAKKEFTDELAKLISKYISCISIYYTSRNTHKTVDRVIPVEICSLIHIKLEDISEQKKYAKELLDQLDLVHNSSVTNMTSAEFCGKLLPKLLQKTKTFINHYLSDEQI